MPTDYRRLALERHFSLFPQAFYGHATNLSIGAGVISADVEFIDYDSLTGSYDIVQGNVLTLTHECDVDPANERFFNDYVLVCPIIDLMAYCNEVREVDGERYLPTRIASIAQNMVYRVFMLPPDGTGAFPILRNGGLLYLNQIRGIHLDKVAGGRKVAALTQYAQRALDIKITNHLLREKSEPLPRTI